MTLTLIVIHLFLFISSQPEGYPCDIQLDLLGAGECEEGLVCYSPSGYTDDTGICRRIAPFAQDLSGDGWYPDYETEECVMNCDKDLGGFCGGMIVENWKEAWLSSTAQECCENKLSWIAKGECVPNYIWI